VYKMKKYFQRSSFISRAICDVGGKTSVPFVLGYAFRFSENAKHRAALGVFAFCIVTRIYIGCVAQPFYILCVLRVRGRYQIAAPGRPEQALRLPQTAR
jgi:hypothetical protein